MSIYQPKFLWGKENPNYVEPSQAAGSQLDTLHSPLRDFAIEYDETYHEVALDTLIEAMKQWNNPDSAQHDEERSRAAWHKSELSEESRSQVNDFIAGASSPDGGGSWSPRTGLNPDCGFMYSPYEERSIVVDSIDDVSAASILDYAEKNKDILDEEEHYLGIWNDPEDGKIYIDVSVRTMDASVARQGCQDHDQIAFFDLQTFSSVTVNQNAQSGQQ